MPDAAPRSLDGSRWLLPSNYCMPHCEPPTKRGQDVNSWLLPLAFQCTPACAPPVYGQYEQIEQTEVYVETYPCGGRNKSPPPERGSGPLLFPGTPRNHYCSNMTQPLSPATTMSGSASYATTPRDLPPPLPRVHPTPWHWDPVGRTPSPSLSTDSGEEGPYAPVAARPSPAAAPGQSLHMSDAVVSGFQAQGIDCCLERKQSRNCGRLWTAEAPLIPTSLSDPRSRRFRPDVGDYSGNRERCCNF